MLMLQNIFIGLEISEQLTNSCTHFVKLSPFIDGKSCGLVKNMHCLF